VPIEIRRFGVGHRRPEGQSGAVAVEIGVVESRAAGMVAELAFGRAARVTPHASPRTTLFLVIEGGGWVGVGDERTRVAAGEAAVWPPDVLHAAWTEGSTMRAIVVELAEDPALLTAEAARGVSVAVPGRLPARGPGPLAPRPGRRAAAPGGEPD